MYYGRFCVIITGQMSQVSRHIIFTGRVQGVGFRFTARNIASRCRLTGIVRNLADGSVEMIAQGHSDDIEGCLRDIQESMEGFIRETKIREIPFEAGYENFRITF